MSVEKLPYLSPHLPCQQVNPVCTRFDSLTSSSSSCCRRPDSSCSCQPGETAANHNHVRAAGAGSRLKCGIHKERACWSLVVSL